MIGIYQDDFIDYLEETLETKVKISAKNIICMCPWCEYKKEKDHYHMYISLEVPIFHCFKANCEQSGTVRKLLKRIEGSDISDKFIDKETLDELQKHREVFVDKEEHSHKIIMPKLQPDRFPNKELYIKKRLKFANIPTEYINGLIYDVESFIELNHIPVGETLFRIKDYLQSNFVGFVTEYGSMAIFRNIDPTQEMRYFKLNIQFNNFLDYYKLKGGNPNSNKIVLAEGIFDIFSEHIYDNLNLKSDVKLYASALSSKFISLIHSIIFHEQVFKPEVIILADRGIPLREYENLRTYNYHIIDTLTVYYNKTGKDFNDTPVTPDKHVIKLGDKRWKKKKGM